MVSWLNMSRSHLIPQAAANITVIECNVHVPVFIGCPYQWTIYENTNTILTGVFATDANVNSQYRTLRYSLDTSSALQPIPSTWFTLPDPYVSLHALPSLCTGFIFCCLHLSTVSQYYSNCCGPREHYCS